MKTQEQLLKVVLSLLLLMCLNPMTGAQQPPEQELPRLSAPVHAALYPEVMCVDCVVPIWDDGYLVHVEFDRDPAVVTMYEKNGKKVLEGRVEPADAAKVSILSAGATQTGGILAVGAGTMSDGAVQRFIVKTDSLGRALQSVRTGDFSAHQVCEATDGTVWTLGYELNYGDSPHAGKNILRHYSLEKGLLGSFISVDSISNSSDASLFVFTPRASFLHCGKDGVSVLLWSFLQYIEVDAATEKLTRWTVDPSLEVPRRANGFAVTEEGRSFVGVEDFCDQEKKITHGLYELNAKSGTSVAKVIPVEGTISKCDPNEIAPAGAFFYLWGADGNELVVQRQGDGLGLSWARVSASVTTVQ